MSIRFSIHPGEFKRIITNVLEFTEEKKMPLKGSPYLTLQAQREHPSGNMSLTGLARYSAATDWSEVEGYGGDEVGQVLLVGEGPKSDVIDDLAKLAASIKTNNGISLAKDSRLSVNIDHRTKLSVWYGDKLVGELADAGDHPDYESRLEVVGQLMEEVQETRALEAPTAMLATTMALAAKVRATGIPASESPVADMARLPGWDHLVLLRIGATFTGLLSTIDRELYAVGGKNHTGHGKPEHLLSTREDTP